MSHMGSYTNGSPNGVFVDQRFKYVCTGAETDTFVVPLPATRLDVSYLAVVTLLSSPTGSQYLCNAPPANYTTSHITVIAGEAPTVGDVLAIVVQELQ